ncbi:S1C family serine protease [Actinocatenispora sera]|uniref:S1C family serine protease n=1 Tax=Actinocatenispora sera TaxID=390989 RepID=UPI00068D743C|nr:trypsin-like peptidase domain-containing protein [Actinocatenispora sera]
MSTDPRIHLENEPRPTGTEPAASPAADPKPAAPAAAVTAEPTPPAGAVPPEPTRPADAWQQGPAAPAKARQAADTPQGSAAPSGPQPAPVTTGGPQWPARYDPAGGHWPPGGVPASAAVPPPGVVPARGAVPPPGGVPPQGGAVPPGAVPPGGWAAGPPPRPPRRWRRGAAAGVAALVLVVGGGAGGAYAVRALTGPEPTPSSIAASTASSRTSAADLVSNVQRTVVDIQVAGTDGSGSEGSGVLIRSDGMILTNAHVLGDRPGSVTVTLADGSRHRATVIGTDPTHDLAVVQVSVDSPLPVATFASSSSVRVGDTVYALGSPLGLTGTVTEGIVSALHRTISAGESDGSRATRYTNMIQTDAALNSGNSGGPLVNTAGQVVGINTANEGSSGSIGLGFAIPSGTAHSVADQLIAGR